MNKHENSAKGKRMSENKEPLQGNNQMQFDYMENANFRDLYHRYQYIRCPEEISELRESLDMPETSNGILTYCFIEEGRGLSFYILCGANYENGTLELGKDLCDEVARVRYSDVWTKDYLDQDKMDMDFMPYESVAARVREQFETKDEARQIIYDWELIDANRNVECPEYVSAIVQKEGLYPEYVWVKCTGFDDAELYGELLEPPKQYYGLQANDAMTFQIVEAEGKIYLIWTAQE